MRTMIGKLVVNGLALLAAGLIVPNFNFSYGADTRLLYIVLVAGIFAVINTYIRPIAKLIALPLTLITLGLFGFVINAVMLLLLAWVAGFFQSDPYAITLANFPPDFSLDAVIAAVLGAIVISLVSTVIDFFTPHS